ncbi:MAG: PilZ domain-containing protein [Gammaproteobacteria bacterium]|nr:PilZ domain-containing protein [Gammaproteobacteria bacterium]
MKLQKKSLQPLKKNDFTERRAESRLPAHLPSILLEQDQTVYTTIINLSSSGIGFLSAKPVEANNEVEITFERRNANTMVPVSLKVHVQSCREVDFEYYIGGKISEKSLEYTKFFETIQPSK